MTCRIERFVAEGTGVMLCISGRLTAQALDVLRAVLAQEGRITSIDLEDVRHVDREAVRLLMIAQRSGVELRHCPAFVREWIAQERVQSSADPL